MQETGDASGRSADAASGLPPLRWRVVVADDRADLRDLIVLLLDDEADFEVVGAVANGEQALSLAHELRPDLMVLDVNMPVLDGLEALRQVKAAYPQMHCVLLSAVPPGLLDQNLVGLADAFLDKGQAVSRLVEELRRVCRRPAGGW